MTGNMISASVSSSAPLAHLWRAWAEPEQLQHWFCDHAWGEIEDQGAYLWKFADFGFTAQYHIAVLVRERLLRLSAPDHVLDIQFEPDQRLWRIQVEQTWLESARVDPATVADCRSGWQISLALCKHYCENYWEQSKRSILLMRPLAFNFERAHRLFADPRELSRWLDVEDRPREILADSGQEVCYRWDRIGGTLECKAFHWKAKPHVALRVTSWAGDYDLEYPRPELESSLDQLQKLLIS